MTRPVKFYEDELTVEKHADNLRDELEYEIARFGVRSLADVCATHLYSLADDPAWTEDEAVALRSYAAAFGRMCFMGMFDGKERP